MIIRYTNTAKGLSDLECLQLAKDVIEELKQDNSTIEEINYSNEVFLHCLRAYLLHSDISLLHKIKWYVEDVEVHFDKNLRSSDVWKYLPEIYEKALLAMMSSRKDIDQFSIDRFEELQVLLD